eukprot:3099803-Rhodomonas_salina.1
MQEERGLGGVWTAVLSEIERVDIIDLQGALSPTTNLRSKRSGHAKRSLSSSHPPGPLDLQSRIPGPQYLRENLARRIQCPQLLLLFTWRCIAACRGKPCHKRLVSPPNTTHADRMFLRWSPSSVRGGRVP